ncbi:MAG: tetratricopeptide repeat protein [bacterium]|nr:tetratricopeptide repeat protein [bacterium]
MRKLYLLVGICIMQSSLFASNQFQVVDDLISESHKFLSAKNWDSAYYFADESYLEAKIVGYSWGKANSQYVKGWAMYKKGNLSEALLLYLESLRIMQDELESSEQPQARASLHMNIGQIYKTYSNFEGALKFYEQGLRIARNNSLNDSEIKLIYNQGVVHKHSGELAKAVEKFLAAKLLALNYENNLWYFNSINQLGLVNHELGRYDSARYYFDQAFDITPQLKRKSRYEAMIYHNKANSYFAEEDYTNAENYYLLSLQSKPRFISFKDLSELYYEIGHYEKAIDLGLKGIEYYPDGASTASSSSIFRTVGLAQLKLGRVIDGTDYMNQYSTSIDKYLVTKESTKKLEDAYQIDLLTKQYFLKLEQQKRQAQIIQLSWFFGIVVFAFILLFFAQRWYQKRKKADATDAIKAIFNQSEILRGSLDREL